MVPQHTRVPQRGVRGAAKFVITAFFRCFIILDLTKLSFLTNFNQFEDLKGAANQKRLKNTAVRRIVFIIRKYAITFETEKIFDF